MTLFTLLSCCLILHLTALIIMAGTTVVDFIGYQTFWKLFEQDKTRATGILELLHKLSRLLGIGAAVLILSGIAMMVLTHGIFGEQLWFRIKFGLVLLLVANGLFAGRRQGARLRNTIIENGPELRQQMHKARINLNRFHILQLCLFFTIIFLSVFKFN